MPLLWLIKPFRYLVGAFRDLRSPRQVAAAVALGMVVGLVPKDNLTAAVLGTLLLMLRVNLAAGALSALVFSWAAIFLDPVSDRIGYAVLTHPALTPFWMSAFQLPIIPWTALNNTVVLGSLIFGLALCYPVYHLLSRTLQRMSDKYAERIEERLKKYHLHHALTGADVATTWRWGA